MSRPGQFGMLGLMTLAAFGLAWPSVADELLLTGKAAYGDWKTAGPGVRRLIKAADMPAPYATHSASNGPKQVARPAGALPQVPPGFTVSVFREGFETPRELRTAPNGDVFLAESGAGRIRILRAAPGAAAAASVEIFAEKLGQPYGMAFYPPGPNPTALYVATTNALLRFPYKNGDSHAGAAPQTIMALPEGGHWTRDVVVAPDGSKLYVAIGSASNVNDDKNETGRANIIEISPDGGNRRVFASGTRNPVTLAFRPGSNDLWTSVNERDGLGDDIPPDYATKVTEGGFYGWPWYYIGGNQDPRHKGAHPELKGKALVPDVLIQPHSAPLGIAFYTGQEFPAAYRGNLFVALHGSWNRASRTGYKLVRIPLENGKATGEYDDFLTGFVTPDGNVWGRPVGVTMAADGALLMSDDGSGTVWRIAYGKKGG